MHNEQYTRRAQIPIRSSRYDYLTCWYKPDENSKWLMVHQTNHFLIYEKATHTLCFDAVYLILKDPKSGERTGKDDIVAVITEITFFRDEAMLPVEEDGFSVLANLVETDL